MTNMNILKENKNDIKKDALNLFKTKICRELAIKWEIGF